GELLQVGPGREELLALASDDERVDLAIGVEFQHQVAQRLQAVHGPGVGGRVGQRHLGGVTVDVKLQAGPVPAAVVAHRSSSSVFNRWRAMMTRMISLVPSRIWCTRLSRS